MPKFNEVSALPSALQQAVAAMGFTDLTAIQALSLPPMLAGRDVVARALTGSGKTAAFGLALLAQLRPEATSLQSLVLCPTRELAEQVSRELRALARFIPNVKVLTLCGGIPVGVHLASLAHVPHIVVGTPGRILDLCRKDARALGTLHNVVLDEADRMLDMGFLPDVADILGRTPAARCTWLFSATYPPEIAGLSERFQRDAQMLEVEAQHDSSVIEQRFHRVSAAQRHAALLTLLLHEQPDACLVFCNTKQDVRDLCDYLWKSGVPALGLHGDLEQRERDETLLQFANGSCRVLVATDVAARGLDIKALPLVISFELPNDAAVYTHRIGRTGRAGLSGVALSLVAAGEETRAERVIALMPEAPAWRELPSPAASDLPAPAQRTLMIEAGRQDKLRPGDIVGALTGEGGLHKDAVGKIDVLATRSYVAIDRKQGRDVLERLRNGKIKGRRFRLRWL
jgi:ATP-independent RNA helicase DbpA